MTNYGGGTTSVINTSTNNIAATVVVGTNPFGVAVNPAGTKGICDERTAAVSASSQYHRYHFGHCECRLSAP